MSPPGDGRAGPWSDLRDTLNGLAESLRVQLWPLPTVGVVLAVALGIGLPDLDARIDDDLPAAASELLFGGGPGAARAVLEAVAGSLITVTSLTFSLTVVTLQLASSQFSPRLLRTFTRDRFVHSTLALFLATFTYALTVLRTVRSADAEQVTFVPQIAVTVAVLLALASVLGLVLFLAHLAGEIRVESMLRTVRADAGETMRRILPERQDAENHEAENPERPRPPADGLLLTAESSGFLIRVDEGALLRAAVDADAVLVLDRHPGDWLVAGVPVGTGWPRTPGRFEPDARTGLLQRLASAIRTGVERTAEQDVGFGLRQLTDVAIKALSPGINDPTTAVHALGHASAFLCELTGRDLGPRLLRDDDGRVRVVLHRPGFADLLELAVAQPRRYGADPGVMVRLTALLREVAWCARDQEQRRAVVDQLARMQVAVAGRDFDAAERARLDASARQVEQALAGRWQPAGGAL